jgi:hypothetical protein
MTLKATMISFLPVLVSKKQFFGDDVVKPQQGSVKMPLHDSKFLQMKAIP